MRAYATAICVVVLGSFSQAASADGLIQKLPEDGSWVTYYVTQGEVWNGVIGRKETWILTIRSIGEVLENGKACRWLEFEFLFLDDDGNERFVEIFKVLIPVKNLKEGEEPLKHVIRAWRKVNDKPAKRVEEQMPGFADNLILPGPLKDRKTQNQPQLIDFQEGRLDLKKMVTGKSEWFGKLSPKSKGETQTTTIHQFWPHEEVPFGVAFARQELRFFKNKRHFRSVFRELTLTGFGTGAISALPDAN